MKNRLFACGVIVTFSIWWAQRKAGQPAARDQTTVEHLGRVLRGVPISPAVKTGKVVFVSATPAFDTTGNLAIGDFPTQMKQVMENVTSTLKSAGRVGTAS